ncbi:MAG: hypothetical protein E5W81_18715 [Mesorhizobium sp.]|nr:MAG: hypothetical protein E5W70_26135 [Mesorhizobium sp.]TIX45906.1 MAG: hypothetical protein E5V36_03855 [Mesorhizobium sp.]TKB69480.1 MAG: hypothetical protein E5W81_18715 [Mesorhizobium sp.]
MHGPTRRPLRANGTGAVATSRRNWRNRQQKPISPLVGEMSGRTERGAVPPILRSLRTIPASARKL